MSSRWMPSRNAPELGKSDDASGHPHETLDRQHQASVVCSAAVLLPPSIPMSYHLCEAVTMSILAMTPPAPLGFKLFVTVLMLALAAVLVRVIRGGSFTRTSIILAIAASMTVVIALEAALPSSYGGGFHDRGVLAAVVGALSAILLRPVRPSSQQRRHARTLCLSALAFVSGPLIGVLLATLAVLFFDVPPMDRGYTFGVLTLVGTLAGAIGASVVTVVSLSCFRRPSTAADEKTG